LSALIQNVEIEAQEQRQKQQKKIQKESNRRSQVKLEKIWIKRID
jgi:hypothetical protein